MFKWMKSGTFSTGLAMFSMFFGAGNIVFPLALGQYAQGSYPFAILGLMLTAVLVPFLGLTAMTLYKGDYIAFFARLGQTPGFLIALFIMALIGPLGATPRCVTLAYSTLQLVIPDLSFHLYNVIACGIIFLLAYSQKWLLDILGYVLTPVLIGSLIIIVVKGLLTAPEALPADHTSLNIFLKGIYEGYNTMDLLGAFFFSSVVLVCLEQELTATQLADKKHIIAMTLKASAIGAILLGLTYAGFSILAARYSVDISDVPQEALLGTISIMVLGQVGGLVACIATVLACLTTAIALAAVFARFLENDIFKGRLGYHTTLAITVIVTYFVSMLRFSGITSALYPILAVIYPALILLSLLNLLHKLTGFKPVKVPVLVVLILSLIIHLTG